MLMQNSSKILQTVASNIDIDVIDPVINALLDMVMLTDQTGLLTGEEKVACLACRSPNSAKRNGQGSLSSCNSPPTRLIWRSLDPRAARKFCAVATEIGLPGENIVPTDEAMDQKEKQQQAMQAQAGARGPTRRRRPSADLTVQGVPPVPPGQGGPPQQAPNTQAPGPATQAQGGAPPGAPGAGGQPRMNLVNQGGPTH